MVIKLDADLEAALAAAAQKLGKAPDALAVEALRQRFLPRPLPFEPQDEWERRLLSIGTDCGVSLSDEAVSSEGLYD
jgi:hypothetical protein